MAAVPFMFSGVFYPKGKSGDDKSIPGVLVGNAWNPNLSVGGGPVVPPEAPPDIKPEPPLTIWGGPFDPPHPAHPIVIPPIPDQPPTTPEKPHEGWNWSAAKSGWYYLYVPGPGDAQPKRK